MMGLTSLDLTALVDKVYLVYVRIQMFQGRTSSSGRVKEIEDYRKL